MDQENNNNQAESLEDDSNSLETPINTGSNNSANPSESSNNNTVSNQSPTTNPVDPSNQSAKKKKNFFQKFNIYLILFTLILLISGVIITIAYLQNKNSTTPNTIKSQTLTQNTLNQLSNSDVSVGAPKQVLNV